MKKVRYALGAIGAAPALGFLGIPAGEAAPAQHAPGHGKTVSLAHLSPAAPDAPLNVNCPGATSYSNSHANITTSGHFSAVDYFYNHHCIFATAGHLNKAQTGLWMRTRIYKSGVQVGQTYYVSGTIFLIDTNFSDTLVNKHLSGTKVCEALVNSANLRVAYGPICEVTG